MRCTNNYNDYLKVTVDEVMRAGFTPKYTRRKSGTTYYVSDNCEYVLASIRDNHLVILDKETYESIGGISIHMKFKEYHNDKIPAIPRIIKDNKEVPLHRVVTNAQKDVQVDHINHNQSCCIKENLRLCNNRQNTINRQDKCGVWEYSDEEGTYYAYDLKANGCNKKRHDSIVECYLAYRDTARAIYKEKELEDFVYDIENDFSKTLGLLIHYYILGDITKEEMYQMNLEYWRDKFNKESIARAV